MSWSWIDATAAFAEALPGYEARPHQDALATEIEENLIDGVTTLAQAGCGTGKSFGYLVPAIGHSKRTKRPVVVATATKALQNQIADKDLPFLASVLPDVRFSVLKGRGNYVCAAKLAGDESSSVPGIAGLREELESKDDHTGDLEDLLTEIDPKYRMAITASGDECPGKRDCPFGEVCYAEAAKQRAKDSHVVVANHALLLRDAQVKQMSAGTGSILPEYSAVIIDEAHELEDYATSALGETLTERGLIRFGDDVATFLGDTNANDGLRRATRALFDSLASTLAKSTTLALSDELLAGVSDELLAVLEEARTIWTRVNNFVPQNDQETIKHRQMRNRAKAMGKRVQKVIMAESDELVRWIEREDRIVKGEKTSTINLAYAPLHVGPELRELLWIHAPAILTSATLAVGTDFAYIAGRLGIDNYESFDAGTPFDFAKQSALYVPADFPEPKEGSWQNRVAAETGELVLAAGGRSLLLFTSRSAMNASYERLAPMFRRAGLTVLKQGDASTGKLSAEFISDQTSVLFALKSFMTGFDAQGDTLRLVVLDKLPFAVPTDVVFAARSAAIDEVETNWSRKAFMTLSVPSMALTLLQAFGRAVRTKSDEAVVAIFDPRLKTKNYGRGILRTLPDAKRIDRFADALAHVSELTARRG